jgi:ABC-type phosphate transport system substrate-binding protein
VKSNNLKKMIQRSLLLAAILIAGNTLAAPILVAHPSVEKSEMTAGEIQKVFLGKTANWADGSRIVLSMLKGGDVSADFLKMNVKKSQKQFGTFWKKAVFSGTGEMPAAFDTEADLVTFVSRTPGAVGYVDESTPHDEVKVIIIK